MSRKQPPEEKTEAARAFGLVLALQIVYLISTVGRGIGTALHLTLKETLKRWRLEKANQDTQANHEPDSPWG